MAEGTEKYSPIPRYFITKFTIPPKTKKEKIIITADAALGVHFLIVSILCVEDTVLESIIMNQEFMNYEFCFFYLP